MFNKNVTDFKLSWHYLNMDEVDNDLSNYYKNYGRNFDNESFKLKLSLLSDYNYLSLDNNSFVFPMFEIEKGKS